MRRFDKLKVIKEANQTLEEKFLFGKSIISEQTDDQNTNTDPQNAGTPTVDDSKKNKSNPAEDFNTFKKELKLNGDNNEASGNIPEGNGKTITIKSDGTYTIFTVDDEELQKGTFKSIGIWPAKHIELKPDNGEDFLKMKNILSGLDKEKSASSESDFYSTFSEIIKVPKNLKKINNKWRYTFYHNKNNNMFYMVDIYPNQDQETGNFSLTWFNGNEKDPKKKVGTVSVPTDKDKPVSEHRDGTFKKFGETFILNDPKLVVSIDKSRKIDAGFIKLLSVIYPEYRD